MLRAFAQTKTFAQLTCEQRHALRTQGFLLIRAVAGSGKTTQLVALVLKDLMDNPSRKLQQIAIITFTRKAGSELRSRLKKAMEAEQKDAPTQEEKTFWSNHLADLPGAPVGTIDSLVQDLLRRLALAGNPQLDPSLGVLDDLATTDLIERALDHLLDEPTHKLKKYLAILQKHHDRRSLLTTVQRFMERGDADSATNAMKFLLESESACRTVAESIDQPARTRWLQQWLPKGPTVKNRLIQASNELINRKTNIVQKIKQLASEWSWNQEESYQSFQPLSGQPLFTKEQRKTVSGLYSDKQGPYSPTLDSLQDQLQPLLDDFFQIIDTANVPLAEWIDQEQYKAWIHLFHSVQERFLELCQEENRYSFEFLARMLEKALEQLTDDEKKACGLPLERVLVDEFQDNTSLQWRITQKLIGGNHLPESWDSITLVGDPEQAIYHWRGSNAQLMELVQREYLNSKPCPSPTWYDHNHDRKDTTYAPSTRDQQIGLCTLSNNWRTASSTLAWIDQASSHAMNAVGVNHQKLEPGPRKRDDRDLHAEVILIKPKPMPNDQASDMDDDTETEENTSSKIQERFDRRSLESLALKLEEIHREKKIPYREMLILAHSFKPFLEPLQEILEARNLPHRSLVRSALWRTQHVRDLVSLVKCLADPDDGFALLAVLRGPCCRLNDSEILYVTSLSDRSDILSGLNALVKKENDQALGRLQADFQESQGRAEAIEWVARRLSLFGTWRQPVDRMPHHLLVQRIFEESGVWSAWQQFLLADISLGTEARQTKLERIIRELQVALQRIQSIEEQRPLTLIRLARLLENHVDGSITETVETELAEGEDLIRIMTVHASKGLEAQVIALLIPEVAKNNRGGHSDSMILLDRQYFNPATPPESVTRSIGLPLFSLTNLDRSVEDAEKISSVYKVACKANQVLNEQEVARLFHVALTRSKSIVIIAGVSQLNANNSRHWPQRWVEEVNDPCVKILCPDRPIEPQHPSSQKTRKQKEYEDDSFYFEMPPIPMGRPSIAVTAFQKLLQPYDPLTFKRSLQIVSDSLREHIGEIGKKLLEKGSPRDSGETGKLIGILVHRALQMGSSFPEDQSNAETLLRAMLQPLIRQADGDSDEESMLLTEPVEWTTVVETARSLIQKILGGEANKLKELLDEPGHAEVDFTLPIPQTNLPLLIIRGRFDRLLGTNRLIDWKTDKGSTEEIIAKYREQMKLYALACYLNQDQCPETVTVHLAMTSTGEVVDLVYSDADLKKMNLWLRQLLMANLES